MHKIIAGACASHSSGMAILAAFANPVLSRCFSRSLLVVSLMLMALPAAVAEQAKWRNWERFREHFIQFDGRVIEHEVDARTTSEAQAYAMFFALVSNQPQSFALLLEWTENNLAGGDLTARLPGWLWGRAPESDSGSALLPRWRLLDENSASDADLWLAYALLEAGRLWQVPRYHALGMSLLRQVSQKEVLRLRHEFALLLPGQRGFQVAEQRWRINPSYYVPQQLALFSRIDPSGPWSLLNAQLPAMLSGCCASGYAPDWLVYDGGAGWQADQGGRLIGAHDAIRVYLWAGMMDRREPGRDLLLGALHGMRSQMLRRGEPPVRIDLSTGRVSGKPPPGFSAAVAPYLDALDEKALLARTLKQLRNQDSDGLYGHGQRYYDQVLALFGLGFIERRYRFSRCGELLPAWSPSASGC